jgi:hypothetical protein
MKKLPEMAPRIAAALKGVTEALDAAGIDYALIGGLAVGVYGHERATKDIDLLISRQDIKKFAGEFVASDIDVIQGKHAGVRIDYIFPAKHEDFLDDSVPGGTNADGVAVVAPAPLIYMKLVAGRLRDQDDVIRLLRAGKIDLDKVRAYLEKHAPQLIDDFDSYATEAKLGDS